MAYYAVIYTYANAPQQLDALRPQHRAYLGRLAEQGSIVASGPLLETDPSTALLIFRATDEASLQDLLHADPFQVNHLVEQTDVAQWNPVIGILADKA